MSQPDVEVNLQQLDVEVNLQQLDVQLELIEAPQIAVELVGTVIIYPDNQLPLGGAVGQILTIVQDNPIRVMDWSSKIDGGTFF